MKDNNKNNLKQTISMKEISKLAGVSVATVSRVINKNGRFSDETREIVESIIKEYNYKPSIVAKGLRTKKTQNIGIIVPDIANEFFASIVLAIQTRLYEKGYSSLIYNTNEAWTVNDDYISMLTSQNVSGIISISNSVNVNHILSLDIPMIFLDRKPLDQNDTNKNVVTIESDNFKGGYLATEEMIKKGAKNIAIIMNRKEVSPSHNRCNGYKKALEDYKIEFREKNVYKLKKRNYDEAHKLINEILKLNNGIFPYDGIFCTSDWLALGAIKALVENNIRLPEDVMVVGFDDITIASIGVVPFTTIRQDVDKMAEVATNTVLEMINGEEIENYNNTVPITIVRRKTTDKDDCAN